MSTEISINQTPSENRFIQKTHEYLPAICHMINDTAQGSLPALLPLFITNYGLTYEQVAIIIFFNTALATVAQPFFGYLADKKNFWQSVPLGILICGFSIASIAFVDSYVGIIMCALISGFGSALFHPEAARWVNAIAGKEKGKAMSYFSVGGQAGFTIGPIIGSSAYIWGVKSLLIFAVIAIVAVTLYLVLKPYKLAAKAERKVKETSANVTAQNDWRSFNILFVTIAARSICFAVLNTFIPIYWITHLGQTTASGNLALSIYFVCGIIVTVLGGTLADRIGYVKAIRYCYISLVPIMLAFTLSDSYWLSMILILPLSFGIFTQYSPMIILGQVYLAKNIGFASGITLGLGITLGGIVAPLIGKLADMYGLQNAWLTLNPIVWIALLSTYFITDLPHLKNKITTVEK